MEQAEENLNGGEIEDVETVIGKDPLKNTLILDNIFSYLSLKDIKSCRGVCKLWNGVSTSIMAKMSTIAIYPESSNASQVEAKSPMAYKGFSKTVGVSFNSFKLKSNVILSKWPLPDFRGFFEDQKQNIKELTIDNINAADEWRRNNEEIRFVDIFSRRLRSDYSFSSLNPYIENNLTHLAIDNSIGSKFIVSTEKLVGVKSLAFKSCGIKITKNCKLAPEKLDINCVVILEDKCMLQTVALNDFVDFKNLKELAVNGGPTFRLDWCAHDVWYHYQNTHFTIKAKNISVRNMSLKSVEIENIQESEWKIKKLLKLRNVPYDKYTKMNFTEMDFGDSVINLAVLPPSVIKLTLTKLENETTQLICPEDPIVNLPNLKYLQILTHSSPFCSIYKLTAEGRVDCDEGELQHGQNFLYCITLFAHCQNLTNLKLLSSCEGSTTFWSTSWIPPNIQHLTLIGDIKTIGERIKIGKLVLENGNLGNLATCLNKLQSDHLVLDLTSGEVNLMDLENFIVPLIQKSYKTFAIGSLTTNILDFQKSSFSKLVDNRAEHYLFEEGNGKSIEKWEFEKLKDQQ